MLTGSQKKEGKTKMRETIKLRFDGQILSKKNRHMVARIGGHSFIKPDQEAKASRVLPCAAIFAIMNPP